MKKKDRKKWVTVVALALMLAGILLYVLSLDEEESPVAQQLDNTEERQ